MKKIKTFITILATAAFCMTSSVMASAFNLNSISPQFLNNKGAGVISIPMPKQAEVDTITDKEFYNEFKTGYKVLHNNSVRRIEMLDNTGRVVLAEDFDYRRTYAKIKDISLVVDSFGGFKKGDKVLYNDSVRRIKMLDNTGRVVLAEDFDYRRTYAKIKDISLVVDSFGGLKKGDKVLYNNSVRRIEMFDNTGRVVLTEDFDYYRAYTEINCVSLVK